MTDHGQLDDAPDELLGAIEAVLHRWLERCVVSTAHRQLGHVPAGLHDAAAQMADQWGPELVERVRELLATDVDEQRTGPLALFREAVIHPGAVLAAAGVPPVERDDFERRAFPDDHYSLSPATWSDVDPTLHDPGIMWGAWKAAVVLRRRREEGLR